jgi:hypothetical protein
MLARMNVLGIACPFWHDPSAALVVDGEVVAAAEQERFCRRKHAPRELPVDAARWCLDFAGLRPEEIDAVAYPWSVTALRRNLWPRRRRYFGRRPGKALKAVLRAGHNRRRQVRKLAPTLKGSRPRSGSGAHRLRGAPPGPRGERATASGFEDCAVASIGRIGGSPPVSSGARARAASRLSPRSSGPTPWGSSTPRSPTTWVSR